MTLWSVLVSQDTRMCPRRADLVAASGAWVPVVAMSPLLAGEVSGHRGSRAGNSGEPVKSVTTPSAGVFHLGPFAGVDVSSARNTGRPIPSPKDTVMPGAR